MNIFERKAQLLRRKQALILSIKKNFNESTPTKVGSRWIRRMRQILKVESDLAEIENQETRLI